MNTLLLLIIATPAIEIFFMIKVGQQVGAFNTVLLIFLTAFVGVYYARIEGLNTLRSGISNLYKNKTPIYEIISGASIALAAALLILPGFITDLFGFSLLFPITRKFLIHILFSKKIKNKEKNIEENILDGEIVEKKEDKENGV
jgi:UPF0716 protein FxsA